MTDKPPLTQILEALANKKVPCTKHPAPVSVSQERRLAVQCTDCKGAGEIFDPIFARLRIPCDHGSHVPPHDDFHKVFVRACRWCAHIRDCPGWTTATESQAADAMGRMMVLHPYQRPNHLDGSWWAGKAFPLYDSPWDAFYRACAQAAGVVV